jgi:hypothetical protein
MQADALVSGSSPVEMCAAQVRRRQQVPAAGLDLALRYIGRLGIDFCKSDLRAGQALLGRGQQPPHGFCAIAYNRMVIVVKVVGVEDTEVELRGGIALFSGLKELSIHSTGPLLWEFRGRAAPSAVRGIEAQKTPSPLSVGVRVSFCGLSATIATVGLRLMRS